MTMTHKENFLRAWRRQGPRWIPIAAGLPYLDWPTFGYDVEELEAVCLSHPILFPGFEKGNLKRAHEMVEERFPDLVAGKPYTDAWGCLWETPYTGMVGAVTVHPLEDWSSFSSLKIPDETITDGVRAIDWEILSTHAHLAKEHGGLFGCGLPHGHTFLRVQDLRGYENLLMDFADEEPLIDELLDVVTDFNLKLIRRFIDLQPDFISIPEDLGMQNSPMITPEDFNRYIAPRYNKLTKPVKEAGILVHEHSDGYILPLMDDIIKMGGDVINLQDLVNGIDNIAKYLKGHISIDLDIDRQNVTVFGSPGDVDAHIKECVAKLGGKEGGLSLTYQPWPMTPAKNMDAAFSAMEKYCVKEYLFA